MLKQTLVIKFVLIIMLLLINTGVQAQIRLEPITRIGKFITCHVGPESYDLETDQSQLYSKNFDAKTAEMQAIFDKVVNFTKLTSNIYTVPVRDPKVNVEICPGQTNYIAYNANWVRRRYAETNNIWVLYALIAHEIGHFARGHDKMSIGSDPTIELEADEYAGETLARMGASLENARAAFESASVLPGHTHPPRDQRISAVSNGWLRISSSGAEKELRAHARTTETRTATIGNSGRIPGLEGRLNPILDQYGRTYFYADNIAIEGGLAQPVKFIVNQPLVVEDSKGNRFELRITSITTDSAQIEYARLSAASERDDAALNLNIVDENSNPVRQARLLAIFADGTYLEGSSDANGKLNLEGLKQHVVTIYCAHEKFAAYYRTDFDVDSQLPIQLRHSPKAGSVIITRTGYIRGLAGRLNPILDSHHRRYLYADNILIENGKKQPVGFALNQPFQVEDAEGNKFALTVVAIHASWSLIDFTRLN